MVHVKSFAHTSLSCVLPAPVCNLHEVQSSMKKPSPVWVLSGLQWTLLQYLEHILPILLFWPWSLQSFFFPLPDWCFQPSLNLLYLRFSNRSWEVQLCPAVGWLKAVVSGMGQPQDISHRSHPCHHPQHSLITYSQCRYKDDESVFLACSFPRCSV